MQIHKIPLGAPCWFEFSSTDASASLPYFCALFDWRNIDQDMGDFGTYSFLQHANGGHVGAHWQMPQAQQAMGVPSNWGVYFFVASVAESHQRALALGAAELVAPMNVSDYGRMSVLRDPTGAVFSIWEAVQQNDDPLVMFERNAPGWVELATRDCAAARSFYQAMFDWHIEHRPASPEHPVDYSEIVCAKTRYGGMLQMTAEWEGIPPHWGLYFVVDDVDATIAKSNGLGGKLCVPAFNAPGVGRIAVLNDPTGSSFYVIAMAST
jgi:uncharacterized protein